MNNGFCFPCTGFLTLALALVGCTRWDTTNTASTLGAPQKVGQRLVGSPMIEETTESALVAGAGGAAAGNGHGGFAVGGLAAGHTTVKRTHCVQRAEIDYTQRIDLTATRTGRGLDLGLSIPMAALGLLVVTGANSSYQGSIDNYNSGFTSQPPETPTAAFAVGGALAVAGAAWLIYSVGFLPNGPRPEIPSQTKTWTETAFVEAEGCGLVAGDRSTP